MIEKLAKTAVKSCVLNSKTKRAKWRRQRANRQKKIWSFAKVSLKTGCVENWSRVVVAYEPLWAMGGGEQCSAFEAQTVHKKLRQWVYDNVGLRTSYDIRIIYGGASLLAFSESRF